MARLDCRPALAIAALVRAPRATAEQMPLAAILEGKYLGRFDASPGEARRRRPAAQHRQRRVGVLESFGFYGNKG
jgi:hypothetical protein